MDKKIIAKYLEWIGTIALISGALLSSVNIYPLNVASFLIGGISWMLIGSLWNKKSLIILNGTMSIIYIGGVIFGYN